MMMPEKKTHIMNAVMKQVWQCPYPAIVRQRAKRLQISSKELRELSLAGLKRKAKTNFGILIKHHHPDTRQSHKSNFGESQGFRRLLNAHHFFFNLTEESLEKFRKKEQENKDWERQKNSFLPWEWEKKKIHIPDGFQEVRRN